MSEIGKVYFDISQRVQYIFGGFLKYKQYNDSQTTFLPNNCTYFLIDYPLICRAIDRPTYKENQIDWILKDCKEPRIICCNYLTNIFSNQQNTYIFPYPLPENVRHPPKKRINQSRKKINPTYQIINDLTNTIQQKQPQICLQLFLLYCIATH